MRWHILGALWSVGRLLPAWLRRDLRRALQVTYGTDYDRWIHAQDTLTDEDRALIRRHITLLENPPLISVVMPVFETNERFLREAIMSVRVQLYPHWELCIADDCSPSPHVQCVLTKMAKEEPRIRWVRREENGNISAASNSALELATGEFVALMDHDDLLSETALYEMAASICADPNVDVLYSDEDHIDDKGRRYGHHFKPQWSNELLLGQNVICHLGVYRRTILERIGGFQLGLEGSQDYDLALRSVMSTDTSRIRHISKMLYHWRVTRSANSFSQVQIDHCIANARRAAADFLKARGIEGAEVHPAPLAPQWNRVVLPIPSPMPFVSIIIPIRDDVASLRQCLSGVLQRTRYQNLEVIVADNGSIERATQDYLLAAKQDARVKVPHLPWAFNDSATYNAAVTHAEGSILVFLNSSIDVIGPDWLREMVSLAVKHDVGCVGAKLLYGNGTIQHAGVLLGAGGTEKGTGVAGHFGTGEGRHECGYLGRYALTTEVSAVTAACMVVRHEVFEAVGGFDEVNLPAAFNDVDFCLRIRERGLRNIWTPFAELYNLESGSPGSNILPGEVEHFREECHYMRRRWGKLLDRDPFYNLVFDRRYATYRLGTTKTPRTWMI